MQVRIDLDCTGMRGCKKGETVKREGWKDYKKERKEERNT